MLTVMAELSGKYVAEIACILPEYSAGTDVILRGFLRTFFNGTVTVFRQISVSSPWQKKPRNSVITAACFFTITAIF